MRIGVKYCGGCKPTYSRRELVDRLAAALGIVIEPVRDKLDWDAVLIVGGCHSCCANHAPFKASKVFLSGAHDYDRAKAELEEIIQK